MRIVKLAGGVIALISLVLLSASCSKDNEMKPQSLWEAGTQKNKIVVISDLHLGVDDRYAETVKNREYLIEFLQHLEATDDVRELVIIGDLLDEWFLPYSYPSITDEDEFYKKVIKNNQSIIDELKKVIQSGIKLVYVPGNHDLTLKAQLVQEVIPGIVQVINEPQGLGTYYTGDRNEIAIEHGHRYDVFSAPDRVTNKELCGNDNTILPAGYFYAVNGASWVVEGMPSVEKHYPVIAKPDGSDPDQMAAYAYYSTIANASAIHTTNEDPYAKLFKMRFAGFNDDYSFMDFYPQIQPDGTISGKLFKNIQRTWGERQTQNRVKKQNLFMDAVVGAVEPAYFYGQAKMQYLENPTENVDVVVFGHTHIPDYKVANGKYYVNDGTWVDNNYDGCFTRTFVIVTTGQKNTVAVYTYDGEGKITDITTEAAKAEKKKK